MRIVRVWVLAGESEVSASKQSIKRQREGKVCTDVPPCLGRSFSAGAMVWSPTDYGGPVMFKERPITASLAFVIWIASGGESYRP